MLAFYALIVHLGLSTNTVIALFGALVAGTMLLVILRHRINLAAQGSLPIPGASDRAKAAPH